MMIPSKPTIQIDTRERTPWTFAHAYKEEKIAGTFSEALPAADYTIKDVPNLVAIERKHDVAELYNNFIPADKRERFDREMEKLRPYKYKYIIVEQTWDALYDQRNFKFAYKNIKWAGSIVLSNIIRIMGEYGVHVIFAGDNAEHTATAIMLRHYNDYLVKNKPW